MLEKIQGNNKIILGLLYLYFLSLTISKFGISLFGGILGFLGIYLFISKSKEKKDYIFGGLFVLGILLQFFSLGGAKSSLVFFYKNYFWLIAITLAYYFSKEKKYLSHSKLISVIEIALFIGILKSFYNFYSIYNLKYESYIRVDSFFDIMRWGIVLVMALLLILPRLSLKKESIFSWIVFTSGLTSLILNNSRGPILSLILGGLFYLIFNKNWKTILSILIFLFFLLSSNTLRTYSVYKKIYTRISSILITETGGNAARLIMWKENSKFMLDAFENNKKVFLFGTGIKNREKVFKEYITKKYDENTIKKYRSWGFSFNDSHNSYLNMLVQTGIIYTTIYYLTLFYFIIKIFLTYFSTKNKYTLSCLAGIGAFYFCGIFYGYSFTYETFLFFFIINLGLIENLGERNDINIRS